MRVNAFFEPKRADIPDKECAWCGASFKPHNARQIYCSNACRNERTSADNHIRYRNERAGLAKSDGRTCEWCHGSMDGVQTNRKTCSQDCFEARKRAQSRASWYRTQKDRVRACGSWGMSFDPYATGDFFGFCFDGRAMRPASHAIMCPVV